MACGRHLLFGYGSAWSACILFSLVFVFTVEVRDGLGASVPFEYFLFQNHHHQHQHHETGGNKRAAANNVSIIDQQPNRVRNQQQNVLDRTLVNQVEDANARRIQTLYQLLEHRPEPQSCYNGRSDRTFRFYCPTPSPDDMENWQCITIDDLCNNIPDCPGAEDEDLVHCMFYMAIQHQTQTLRQIIVRHYEQVHTVPNTVRN